VPGLDLPLDAAAHGAEGPVEAGDPSELADAVGAAGVDQESAGGGQVRRWFFRIRTNVHAVHLSLLSVAEWLPGRFRVTYREEPFNWLKLKEGLGRTAWSTSNS
jgi:hypothetical protein